MPIGDHVLDGALTVLQTEANRLDICHTLPTTSAPVLGTPAIDGSDVILITQAEVGGVVYSVPRIKTVVASARIHQGRGV